MQFCFCNISPILLLQYQHVWAIQDQPKAAAPSATTYELEMSKASTSSSSWADAALAGLPPDDEAVQMAELAATAGRSIEVPILVHCSLVGPSASHGQSCAWIHCSLLLDCVQLDHV